MWHPKSPTTGDLGHPRIVVRGAKATKGLSTAFGAGAPNAAQEDKSVRWASRWRPRGARGSAERRCLVTKPGDWGSRCKRPLNGRAFCNSSFGGMKGRKWFQGHCLGHCPGFRHPKSPPQHRVVPAGQPQIPFEHASPVEQAFPHEPQ
jgi:hypothetical protein